MTEDEALRRVKRHQIFGVVYMVLGLVAFYVSFETKGDWHFVSVVATVLFFHGMVERRWRAREVYGIFHGHTMNQDDFK